MYIRYEHDSARWFAPCQVGGPAARLSTRRKRAMNARVRLKKGFQVRKVFSRGIDRCAGSWNLRRR
jgi:hypothetical protein